MKHSQYQDTKVGFITWAELKNDPMYRKVQLNEVLRPMRELINLMDKKENKPMTKETNMTTSYRVLKNSRVATKTTFSSYERARQWVRKQIRKNVTSTQMRHAYMWDGVSRNPPSISNFDYSIRKVG